MQLPENCTQYGRPLHAKYISRCCRPAREKFASASELSFSQNVVTYLLSSGSYHDKTYCAFPHFHWLIRNTLYILVSQSVVIPSVSQSVLSSRIFPPRNPPKPCSSGKRNTRLANCMLLACILACKRGISNGKGINTSSPFQRRANNLQGNREARDDNLISIACLLQIVMASAVSLSGVLSRPFTTRKAATLNARPTKQPLPARRLTMPKTGGRGPATPASLQPRKRQASHVTSASASSASSDVPPQGTDAKDGSPPAQQGGILNYLKAYFLTKKTESAALKERIGKLGLAAVLAYGLVDGLTYTTAFCIAFVSYEKATGLNPARNLQALAGVVVAMWAGNNVTRPFRIGFAAAFAPLVDRGLKKVQEVLRLPKQIYAFIIVTGTFAAICLSIVGSLILWRLQRP
eukprot:jgi/Mesvir1/24480/Mv21837-RA.1